ncbi:MAG: molybdopterin molybdotransferase MoeA [Flavobacteriales bacterium]
MISVKEAEQIILSHAFIPTEEIIPLDKALGRTLFKAVLSDTDLPPFDRVMMDGIAIRFEDWENGQRSFPIQGIQQAGEASKFLEVGCALEIMTGAVCPQNADTIVPYEEIELSEKALILSEQIKSGQNIHRKGSDKKEGDILIQAGAKLNAAQLSVAAASGYSSIGVCSRPSIHVFSTGNELVEIDQIPNEFQIRRSNVYGLKFLLEKEGIPCTESHLPDEKEIMRREIESALTANDVILLSGGVSKGKFDFLPEILNELGIEKRFHGIAQKPGKPFWFGQGRGKWVFAFPGNPVSTMMCATRYLIPWLRFSNGLSMNRCKAHLSSDFVMKGTLPFFLQVKTIQNDKGITIAIPFNGSGSGDYANLAEVNGFAELPSDKPTIAAGTILDVYLFD